MINEAGPAAQLWVPRGPATKGQQLAGQPGPVGPKRSPLPASFPLLSSITATQAWGLLQDLANAVPTNHTNPQRTPLPGSPPSQRPQTHTAHITWLKATYTSPIRHLNHCPT